MAEVDFPCSSPSEKLEKFEDPNCNVFSFEAFSECLDAYSNTTAPKNSSSWTDSRALLGGGGSGGSEGAATEETVYSFQSRLDEIVKLCFSKTEESEDFSGGDPVQIIQLDDQLRLNNLWSKITKNFGNILPVDWCTTRAKFLQEKSLEIKEIKAGPSGDLDISDDEELQQAFDLHSLIISSLNQEPMFTAEQIISEIEGMLDDSPSASADEFEDFTPKLLKFRERSQELKKSLQSKPPTDLDGWSVRELSELYDELDATVREYSEVLIQQLALREELEYENELMNQFISLHVNIQKKKRELQSDRKRGTTPTADSSISISNLTTQIPYCPTAEPVGAELLEVYVKILKAMDSDSSNLPTLLTDYILKVVCPTS